MLTIKPSSSQSKEPDPAFQNLDPARIIFLDDVPKQPTDDDDEVQPYKMAKRTQGSTDGNSHHGDMEPKSEQQGQDETDLTAQDSHLDTSSKALTDEYKKSFKDETTVKEQSEADESVQDKVSAVNAPKELNSQTHAPQVSDIVAETNEDKPTPDQLTELAEKSQEKFEAIIEFNRLAQDKPVQTKKQPELSAIIASKNVSVEPIQKIESKKHRPIDIGTENRSKLELTKDVNEGHTPQKKKLSLHDLNLEQGFSEFVRKGNANFSSDGNADEDNEMGLKRKSYMTQIAKVHENAYKSYPEKFIIKHQDQIPPHDSIINMIIERSGKVSLMRLQSSGNQSYDDYHMKVLIFMGDFPPIPKFIESMLPIKSIYYTATSGSSLGSYQPGKLQI